MKFHDIGFRIIGQEPDATCRGESQHLGVEAIGGCVVRALRPISIYILPGPQDTTSRLAWTRRRPCARGPLPRPPTRAHVDHDAGPLNMFMGSWFPVNIFTLSFCVSPFLNRSPCTAPGSEPNRRTHAHRQSLAPVQPAREPVFSGAAHRRSGRALSHRPFRRPPHGGGPVGARHPRKARLLLAANRAGAARDRQVHADPAGQAHGGGGRHGAPPTAGFRACGS